MSEAAKLCSVNRTTMVRWTNSGEIKSYSTLGGHNRILKKDLEKWLRENKSSFDINELQNDITELQDHKARILIVDDEEMGRTVMEGMVSKYGQPISVSTGKDAIRVYEKELEKNKKFDLVLLDISLEDINGLEVLKQIKAIEKSKEKAIEDKTVILMVTAHSEKNIVVDCIRAGCKAYFIKPLKQKIVDKKLFELGFEPVN